MISALDVVYAVDADAVVVAVVVADAVVVAVVVADVAVVAVVVAVAAVVIACYEHAMMDMPANNARKKPRR